MPGWPWEPASGGVRRRRWHVAFGCAIAGAAAPASGQLPRSSTPLPGSSFQGADGNQDDEGGFVDWQALEAAGSVHHNPDANDSDTSFTGGSAETEPGLWDLTTAAGGVTPNKDNIRDAWSAVDQPAADTFLYLGFTREAATGNTFLTFELNRDTRVDFRGTRVSRLRILVNGRVQRQLTLRALQRRVRPRVTLRPGRYRVVCVTFQRGSGSPPVTLSRIVTICGRPALPRFTG